MAVRDDPGSSTCGSSVMQVACPCCGKMMEYTSVPPRFCMHCGQPLPGSSVPTIQGDQPPTHALDPEGTIPFITPSPSRWAVPERVGGYRILQLLGGGGMGSVHLAEHEDTGRRVAVKLIRAEFTNAPEAVERFRREGRLASTIVHPRCVFVLAADEEDGRPYIVMELMPGSNLQDILRDRGRLPVAEAVKLILDVIEGLEEAHRLGVVHRDVKPSNCFIDADGRIKVGDFGLAKSLIGPGQLTRSGAFLGTVLFASPEQIRNEDINHLTDIYSVCATLYYLLTGRAPFEDVDAAASLARTVSEAAPSMRLFRPELPKTLDEVVLRGLARNRRQRWQSMEDLRLALVPFVETPQKLGDLGWRVSAVLCDSALIWPAELMLLRLLHLGQLNGAGNGPMGRMLVALGVSLIVGLLYFGLCEWLWGCTPGKFLTRLRVRTVATQDRPSLWQALTRSLGFYLCLDVVAGVTLLGLVVAGLGMAGSSGSIFTARLLILAVVVSILPAVSSILGGLVLATTMRRRNGYRGIHEWLSGTHVIRLPLPKTKLRIPARLLKKAEPAPLPSDLPSRIGTFTVKALVRRAEKESFLLAEDEGLERRVWVWLHPAGEEELPPARCSLARATRSRWLAAGDHDGQRWDAFVAAPGHLLSDLVTPRRRLNWSETLDVLMQLTAELIAASKDETLPENLSVDQVWLQPGGAVMLLDVPPRETSLLRSPMELLRHTAVLALEGKPLSSGDHRSVKAPVPGYARELLDRLMGIDQPFASLEETQQALVEVAEYPSEIDRPKRGLQLALSILGQAPGLAFMLVIGPLLMLGAYLFVLMGVAYAEVTVEDRPTRLPRDAAALVAARPGLPQAIPAVQLLAHEEQYFQAQKRLPALDRNRRILMESWSGFIRRGIRAEERPFRKGLLNRMRLTSTLSDDEIDLGGGRLELKLLEGPGPEARELSESPLEILGLLAFWPLLWAVGAAVLRGGLSTRLAGIVLLNADGSPASRWRCACRVLVVYAPIVLVLAASLFLDIDRVASMETRGESALEMTAWLSWVCWWQAVMFLGVWVWLAVAWPGRGWHDRLAGVYAVPR